VNVSRFFMFEIMYRDVLAGEINALRNRVGLPNVADWAAFARFPQRNIGAWPAWFAPPEPEWPQELNLTLPGFLTMDELEEGDIPAGLENFLQDGEAPVLIAGSTGTYLNKGFYTACVDGCRLAGRRAILVTRFPELVPNPLPEQIKWFSSLPFASLMPRMAAVIHHGGLGTLARTMHSGIPQLVLAVGSDRPDNAQRVQRLGIGEYLPPAQWKPEPISESLNRLIDSSVTHTRCQEMAAQIRVDDPALVIKNVVDNLVSRLSA
jgi:UDP:flavonoid glycosyltransferase YjiC (YdhE family)